MSVNTTTMLVRNNYAISQSNQEMRALSKKIDIVLEKVSSIENSISILRSAIIKDDKIALQSTNIKK